MGEKTRWVCLTEKEIDCIQAMSRLILAYTSPQEKRLVEYFGEKKVRGIVAKLEKSQRTIKVSSRKGKARDLQMWVCQKLADLLGIPFDQQDEQCLIHSREMGQSGVDVILRGKAYEKIPFDIECKNTENFNLTGTIRQASHNTKEGRDWLIVFRNKAIQDTVVFLSWAAFEKLYKRGGKK
jgi:hypothetical protein